MKIGPLVSTTDGGSASDWIHCLWKMCETVKMAKLRGWLGMVVDWSGVCDRWRLLCRPARRPTMLLLVPLRRRWQLTSLAVAAKTSSPTKTSTGMSALFRKKTPKLWKFPVTQRLWPSWLKESRLGEVATFKYLGAIIIISLIRERTRVNPAKNTNISGVCG